MSVYYGYREGVSLALMIGETLTSIEGMEVGSEEITFKAASGREFRMWHSQDCCESVNVEDVAGDPEDLIGSPIVLAEEVSNEPEPDLPGTEAGRWDDSHTWTFVKFATAKGYVTLRWFGSSNGYYSEEPSFREITRTQGDGIVTIEHPAPWWYRLALRLVPGRCREIPEAVNPDRIVLRQVALWKHHAYLQQFASAEDPRFMHSHPFRHMLAIGLWGRYREHRIAGASIERRAPYLYVMDGGHVHHVQDVSPGHTSIFIGIGRAEDGAEGDKRFYGAPDKIEGSPYVDADGKVWYPLPWTSWLPWQHHIRVKVKRL